MTTATSKSTQLSNNTFPIFKSELTSGHELRVLGTPSEPYFVAKDIAQFLGYGNTRQAIIAHIDKEDIIDWNHLQKQGGTENRPPNFQGHTQLINESGLYSLILRSNKPIAKKFKRWVTSEVLPSIRKTGEYKINQELLELKQENQQLTQTNSFLHTDLKDIQN